jgi:hypothetical protein
MARRGAGLLTMLSMLLWTVVPANAAGAKKKAVGVAKYVIVNVLLAAADYESAHAVQHRGGCRESNPAFGPYPSRGRFYAEGLAIDAGPELVGWLLHRKHARLWRAPFALVAAWHGAGMISNLRCSGKAR